MTDGPRVVIPFVRGMLWDETRAMGEAVNATFVDLTGDPYAYGKLIQDLWHEAKSVILVEQDIQAEPRLLGEMATCPEPWCAGFGWRFSGAVMPGEAKPQHPIREKETALFLNKFDASLLARTPNVPSAVRVRWTQVDLALFGVLAGKPHLHEPAVVHLRQEHPAWAATMTEQDYASA